MIFHKPESFIVKNERKQTNWNLQKQVFSTNIISEMLRILRSLLTKHNFYDLQVNDIRHIAKENYGEFVIISVLVTDDLYEEVDLHFIFRKYLDSTEPDYLDLLF